MPSDLPWPFIMGKHWRVLYTNHRGETAVRNIQVHRVIWTPTEWHEETQWVAFAWDTDRKVVRWFALKDMRPVVEDDDGK